MHSTKVLVLCAALATLLAGFDTRAQGDCTLGAVSLVQPTDMATLYANDALGRFSLALEAETDCAEDTAQVAFFFQLEGETTPTALEVDTEAPYTATIPLLRGDTEQTYTLTAVATPVAEGGAEVQTGITYRIMPASTEADADANGLPDMPYALLDRPGDSWRTLQGLAGGAFQCLSSAVVLYGYDPDKIQGPEEVSVTLDSQENLDQSVTVTASTNLLRNNEIGVLIVQMAPDAASLLSAAQAERLGTQPAGKFDGAAQYVHVAFLVSSNGGLSFAHISTTRLGPDPIRLSLKGLPLEAGHDYTLATHPLTVEDTDNGIAVTGNAGVWRSVSLQAIDTGTGVAEADLTMLGVVAPFEIVDTPPPDNGPIISITIDPYRDGPWLLLLSGLGILQLVDGGVGGGGPCFIATAAYGTSMAAEIEVLRVFRNDVLLESVFGTAFVDIYYRISPPIADVIAEHAVLRAAVRGVLTPVIALILLLGKSVVWLPLGFVPGLLFAVSLRRLKKVRGAS